MKLMFRFLKPDENRPIKKYAECAVEFTEGFMKGTRLIGFTVNENAEGLYVGFPSYIHKRGPNDTVVFDFLWSIEPQALDRLETYILDEFERLSEQHMPAPKTIIRVEPPATLF